MIWVKTVAVLDGFLVQLEFSDGERKTVDLDPLMRGPIFEPLRSDQKLFCAVRVDEELGTIVWPNGADIDPDVLYGSQVPAWMETSAGVKR
jgi:Protein of unknown function (DUF2442)